LYEGKEGAFSGYSVLDKSGSEGTDWISSDVEYLNFNNGKTIVTLNNGSISSVTLNSKPTGTIDISGNITVGSTLRATTKLQDEDGIGVINYKWQCSNDGNTWGNLTTGEYLNLDWTYVGCYIRLSASYTDLNGTLETVTSQQTNRVPPFTKTHWNTISLIVDKNILGTDPVLLKDVLEVTTWTNNIVVRQTIEYNGVIYDYKQIDPLITIVTRNGDFTEEFRSEFNSYLMQDANLSLAATISLVGSTLFDEYILRVAGSDGNFVG